jgi:hypothetical protein
MRSVIQILARSTARRWLALAALAVANVLAVSPAAGQAGGAEVLRAAALLAALCGAASSCTSATQT